MRGYQVQVSSNGTTWSSVLASGFGSNSTTIAFPTQTAQYIRVTLTTSSNYYWLMDEINLYP